MKQPVVRPFLERLVLVTLGLIITFAVPAQPVLAAPAPESNSLTTTTQTASGSDHTLPDECNAIKDPVAQHACVIQWYTDNGISLYDYSDQGSCSAGVDENAVLNGKTNLAKIFNFFRQQGLSDVSAAAAVGNIDQESGGDPTIIQGGGHTDDPSTIGTGGWGIIQWTPGKKLVTDLKDPDGLIISKSIVNQSGVTGPISELATQLQIVLWHMTNTSPTGAQNMMPGFKRFTTPDQLLDAVTYFHNNIEGSADSTMANRLAKASNALRLYGGQTSLPDVSDTTPGTTTASTCCAGSTDPSPADSISTGDGGGAINSSNWQSAPAPADDYTHVQYSGVTLNKRTLEMLKRAEGILGKSIALSQGSYNAGGVAASAGTHDGGGALDVSGVGSMSDTQITDTVKALREAGFAAWHRIPSEGPWEEHIHAIAIGDKQMSSGAAQQITAYFAGKNGLADNGPDTSPDIGRPIPDWAKKYGSGTTGNGGDSGGTCTSSGVVLNSIVQTAIKYAWPDFHAAPYYQAQPAYDTATEAAKAAGEFIGVVGAHCNNPSGNCDGLDSGAFVTRVIRDSGADPGYNPQNGNNSVQLQYLLTSGKWVHQDPPKSTADVKPGDIAINGNLSYIYVGHVDGFHSDVASANNAGPDGNSWRAPMAGHETAADPIYQWFRLK